MRETQNTQWIWGPTAHWKLYFSLKKFSKKLFRCSANTLYGRSRKRSNNTGSYSTLSSRDSSTLSTISSRRSCGDRARKGKKTKKRRSSLRTLYSRSSSCTSLSSRPDVVLTNDQVNTLLWKHESVLVFKERNDLICESNQLAANDPSEDQLFVTRSSLNVGDILVGVIDGHGGSTLANIIKERLPYYLHSSLCDKEQYNEQVCKPTSLVENVLEGGDDCPPPPAGNELWTEYLNDYMDDLLEKNESENNVISLNEVDILTPDSGISFLSSGDDEKKVGKNSGKSAYAEPFRITEAIRTAFMRLDNDLIKEVRHLSKNNKIDSDNQGLALSGCCALVAYISDDELYIANCGDCRAILGARNHGVWSAIQLTTDHTASASLEEVERIIGEHPDSEARSCIQYGRLLGRLAPLRAFGDIQFKLTSDELVNIFKFLPNYNVLPGLQSPPYLTAEPDVFHYKLEGADKFVVLASDGLWDLLTNDEVIELVAAYIEGTKSHKLKERAHLYGVANCNDIIEDPMAYSDTFTENVASFLIRFALGGYDKENLRSMLALPYPDVRLYRDDISVSVIFLNRYFEENDSKSLKKK